MVLETLESYTFNTNILYNTFTLSFSFVNQINQVHNNDSILVCDSSGASLKIYVHIVNTFSLQNK